MSQPLLEPMDRAAALCNTDRGRAWSWWAGKGQRELVRGAECEGVLVMCSLEKKHRHIEQKNNLPAKIFCKQSVKREIHTCISSYQST